MSRYIKITNPDKVKFKEEEEELEQIKPKSYDEADNLKQELNKYIDNKLKNNKKNLHYLNHVLRSFCIKELLRKYDDKPFNNNSITELLKKVNNHYKNILKNDTTITLSSDITTGLTTRYHEEITKKHPFINYVFNETYKSIKDQINKNINTESEEYKKAIEKHNNLIKTKDEEIKSTGIKRTKTETKRDNAKGAYLSYIDNTPVNDNKEIDNDNIETIAAEEEQKPEEEEQAPEQEPEQKQEEEPKPKINDSRNNNAANVKIQDETNTSDIKKRVNKLVDDTQSEVFKEPEQKEEQTPEQTPEEEQKPEEEEAPEEEAEEWPRSMYKHFNNMLDAINNNKKLGNSLYIYTDFCEGVINEIDNGDNINKDIASNILDYVNLFNSAIFGPDGKWNNGFNNGKILNIISNRETIRDGIIKNNTRLMLYNNEKTNYKDLSWLQLKHLINTLAAKSNTLANKFGLPLLKTIIFTEVLNKNIISYNSLKNNEANQYGYIDTDNVYGVTEMLRNNEVLQGLISKGIITKDGYGNYTYDNEPINISELTNIITKARLQDILTRSRGSLTEMQKNNKAVYQTVSKALQRRRKMFIHINKSAEPTINKLNKEKQNGIIANGKYKINPLLLRNNLK